MGTEPLRELDHFGCREPKHILIPRVEKGIRALPQLGHLQDASGVVGEGLVPTLEARVSLHHPLRSDCVPPAGWLLGQTSPRDEDGVRMWPWACALQACLLKGGPFLPVRPRRGAHVDCSQG